MGEIKDGGTAFACASENGHQPGMSLRDYAAIKIAASLVNKDNVGEGPNDETDADAVAWAAYRIADALLSHRETKPLAANSSSRFG